MISTLVFLIILSILVVSHELGHFLAARALGVGVDVFSLGFGKRIAGLSRGRTDYRLSALPLGGYVKMVGEDPGSEVDPELAAVSFSGKPVWARMIIVAAGPAFNLILSTLVFFAFFAARGVPELPPVVGDVSPGLPAMQAGLKPGDRILTMAGKSVRIWDDISGIIQENGEKPLAVKISRRDPVLVLPSGGLLCGGIDDFRCAETFGPIYERSLTMTPVVGESENKYTERIKKVMIGIGPGPYDFMPAGLPKTAAAALGQTWQVCYLTVGTVGRIFTGAVSASKSVGGPISMARTTGVMTRDWSHDHAGTLWSLLFFLGLLSASLGIINLFPVPVLDGGHLLFFVMEAAMRRPVSLKIREAATRAGVVIIMILMVFFIVNDILRWVTGA